VPPSVRAMHAPRVEIHELRSVTGDEVYGEQVSRARVSGERLELDIVTVFADGGRWDEQAVMDLRDGYRARSFRKTERRGGRVTDTLDVDFTSGAVTWTSGGERHARTFDFAPDTFIGPMLALVLAGLPARPGGSAELEVLTFRPDPSVYTVQADVVQRETFRIGAVSAPTTKVRLKADLGPLRNAVLAALIPTHYFWFTRDGTPEFFAFEGTLAAEGPETLMVPEARVGRRDGGDDSTRVAGRVTR